MSTVTSELSARPAVSVVIPNYNYAKTLGACLAAVYAQSYRPAEVIVVDDASTDGSPRVAREYPCTLIELPGNRGAAAARNAGVAASTGEVLFFVDSDVALEPDAIATAVRLLREDPTCGCVYGLYAAEPLVDDGLVEHCRTVLMRHAFLRARGYTNMAIFALAAMPAAVFAAVGPFDESIPGAGGEDNEYSARLVEKHRILLTDEIVGRHDDDDRLLPVLAKTFRRAQYMPYWARNRLSSESLKVYSAPGALAAALTAGTLPLALTRGRLRFVPAAMFAAFAAGQPSLFRFAAAERGARFLPAFAGVHFLANVALMAGVAVGYLRIATGRAPAGRPVRPERPPDGSATPGPSTP